MINYDLFTLEKAQFYREEAITAAKKVFASQEFGEYCKAWKACAEAQVTYAEARKACNKTWDAYLEARDARNKAREDHDKSWKSYAEAYDAYAEAYDAYAEARDTYVEVREACLKTLDACAALVGGVTVLNESRAFNLPASDRKGVYSVILTRKEVWAYDGVNCPNHDTVDVVWRAAEESAA